jgi:predicted DNA-binding protein
MTTVLIQHPEAPPVARPRKNDQVTFRLPPDLLARLEEAASGLSLEVSSLLRTMIREHLPDYEDKADQIRKRESKPKGRTPSSDSKQEG